MQGFRPARHVFRWESLEPPASIDHRRHRRRDFPLDPLHRSAAAANDLRHLEDAETDTKLLADGILELSTNRRATSFFPWSRTRSSPAITLNLIIDRSSSANTVAICIIARPNGPGAVDTLLFTDQRRTGSIEFPHRLCDMRQRASETIHGPNQKNVEATVHGVPKHLVKRRALLAAVPRCWFPEPRPDFGNVNEMFKSFCEIAQGRLLRSPCGLRNF
jgi:hypothetical protein